MKKTQMLKKSLFMTAMFLIMCFVMLLPSTDVSAQVKLNTSNVTLSVGQSKTIKLSGTSKKAKWSSNKPAVATVSSKGKIKAVSKGTATITAKVGKKSYKCKVLVFQTSSSGDAKVDKKVKAIIQKEIRANMTDVEKVKAIHDYIILNCEYGNYSLGAGNTTSIGKGISMDYVKEVLLLKETRCLGYASTFNYFMDILNIPCKTIIGKDNGTFHAWNMVNISGNWYNIDVTYDDLDNGILQYEYFLVPNSKMKGRTWQYDLDIPMNEDVYIPICTSNSNKFASSIAPISKTPKQAAKNLYSEYKKGSRIFTIVIPKKNYSSTFFDEASTQFESKINPKYVCSEIYTYKYGNYILISFKLI